MTIIKKKNNNSFVKIVEELKGFRLGDLVVTNETNYGFARDTIYEIFELSFECDKDGNVVELKYSYSKPKQQARIKPVFHFFNSYAACFPERFKSGTQYTLVSLSDIQKIDLVTLLKNKAELESVIQHLVKQGMT